MPRAAHPTPSSSLAEVSLPLVPHRTLGGWRLALACGVLLLGLSTARLAPAGADSSDPGRPIVHHDLEAQIDPATSTLAVVDRVRLEAPSERDAPVHFLLNENLTLEAVELDGFPLEVRSHPEGWRPRDFWRRPDFSALDAFEVVRQHTLDPPPGGWPSRVEVTIRYAGVVLDSLEAPKVAYSRGFETTSGLITDRGAYLEGATFWIPWTSDDLFTFRLKTILPAGWHSMSQGARIEHRTDAEGRSVTVWEEVQPMEEVYLVAGPYVIREQRHGAVSLYTYTYADTPQDLCQRYLDATGDYLDLYEGKFGAYPFAKFALVENWWQTGFGMPSFTLLGDRVIRLPFIVHTSYGHEILHNWWGNGVYVDAETGNWCEGLTTYGADYFYKERESEAAARDYRRAQLVSYLDHATSGGRDFALRRFREREDFATQAVGYGKTMMVFHMLRSRIGDEAFAAGLRALYAGNRHQPASWDDVVIAFESVAAARGDEEDLAAWFEQWIGRPGALELSIGEVTQAGATVTIELLQSEPTYDVRVPVTVQRDGEPERRTVSLSGPRTEVTVPSGAAWVAVDSGYDLFRKLHREEIPPTLSQTLGADSTLVVVGNRTPEDVAGALRQLGREWSANQNMLVIDEAAATPERRQGRALYLFGPGDLADRALEQSEAFGTLPAILAKRATDENLSWIYCVRDPADPELAWTVVLPANVDVVPALGRKIPHYGRYSSLLFDGENNVEKGAWQVESSPLRIDLTRR